MTIAKLILGALIVLFLNMSGWLNGQSMFPMQGHLPQMKPCEDQMLEHPGEEFESCALRYHGQKYQPSIQMVRCNLL